VQFDDVEVEHVDLAHTEQYQVLDHLIADRACADHRDARRGDLLLREPVDQVVSSVALCAHLVQRARLLLVNHRAR
jgi:hypothetical protein